MIVSGGWKWGWGLKTSLFELSDVTRLKGSGIHVTILAPEVTSKLLSFSLEYDY